MGEGTGTLTSFYTCATTVYTISRLYLPTEVTRIVMLVNR